MKLTTTQVEILKHRLEVPDAMADALIDSGITLSDGSSPTRDKIEESVERVERRLVENNELPPCLPGSLVAAILVDAVEGSTYFAGGEFNCRLSRQADHLEDLVQKATGEPVVMPRR